MNIDGALLAIAAVAAAAAGVGLADVTAIVVAFGTLIAGIVHARRLRIDRAKVVEEVTSSAEGRIREELNTAWAALDRERARARERELELEEDLVRTRRRVRELESERDALGHRVTVLERRLDELGDVGVGPGH